MTYTENIIPIMTSNTAPSGTVTYSDGLLGAEYDGFKAFDQVGTTLYYSQGNAFPKSLTYQFPEQKVVAKYTITASGTVSPKTWKFQGSNDGTAFSDLDSQSNVTSWGDQEKKEYEIANVDRYNFYRITESDGNNGLYMNINELEMMERRTGGAFILNFV